MLLNRLAAIVYVSGPQVAEAQDTSTSLDEGSIQWLPIERDHPALADLLPGVVGSNARGEGAFGNNYLIDGFSIRDPATHTWGQALNVDAIRSVRVHTYGAPAEFGLFTGMLVEVEAKEGGAEHHGNAALYYRQHAYVDRDYEIFLLGSEREAALGKPKMRIPELSLTAGGPLVADRLWYFAAVGVTPHTWRVGPGLGVVDASVSRGGSAFGKLTWQPSDAVTLRYSFNGQRSVRPSFDASGVVRPEAASDRVEASGLHLLRAEFRATQTDTVELRVGSLHSNIDVLPTSRDPSTPARLDHNGVLWDNAYAFDRNDRTRIGIDAIYDGLLDGLLGSHHVRAGAGAAYQRSRRTIEYTGLRNVPWYGSPGGGSKDPDAELRSVGRRYSGTEELRCTDAVEYADCAVREERVNAGPRDQPVTTAQMFLQDTWQPVRALTVDLGVRLDVEDGRNDGGIRPIAHTPGELGSTEAGPVGPFVRPAPRLGITLGQGPIRVLGHLGRYNDLAGTTFWQWANTMSGVERQRFVRQGPGEDWQWSAGGSAESLPLRYTPEVGPHRLDRLSVGVEGELANGLVLGLRGTVSQTTGLPEDHNPDLGEFYIDDGVPKTRGYRGLDLTVHKAFDGRWQLFGGYTLSESYGHTPGSFEAPQGSATGSNGNNVGVYLDDVGSRTVRSDLYESGLGWLLDGLKGVGRYDPQRPQYHDDAGYFGYLPEHALHRLTVSGSWMAPFGTSVGVIYDLEVGAAWQKQGSVGFYGEGYSFPQGRGSRTMPALHVLDIRLSQTIGLGAEGRALDVMVDVFNAPGANQATAYVHQDGVGFGSTRSRQDPRSIRLGLRVRY